MAKTKLFDQRLLNFETLILYFPACKMGYDSKLLVPQSTNVIIPEYLDNKGANGCQVAYKICHCGHKGSIGHCRQVSQCIRKKHCVISTGVVKGNTCASYTVT